MDAESEIEMEAGPDSDGVVGVVDDEGIDAGAAGADAGAYVGADAGAAPLSSPVALWNAARARLGPPAPFASSFAASLAASRAWQDARRPAATEDAAVLAAARPMSL